jgi:hypothetical protein
VFVTNAIEDLAGNYLAINRSWYFSTVSPPIIMQMKPGPDSMNIKVTTSIMVVFNEAIDKTSVNPMIMNFYDESGTMLDGLITYNNDTFAITLQPTNNLNFTTTYRLELNDRIRDLQGNNLEQNVTWFFTTGKETDEADNNFNVIIYTITVSIILLLVIMMLLIGTGTVKLPQMLNKKGRGPDKRIDEHESGRVAIGSIKPVRIAVEVPKGTRPKRVVKGKRVKRAHPKPGRKRKVRTEEIDDTIDEDEDDYESWPEEDEIEEDQDDDLDEYKEEELAEDGLTIDWQD